MRHRSFALVGFLLLCVGFAGQSFGGGLGAASSAPAGRSDGNDTPDSATTIAVPHEGDYAIDPAGDIDWFRAYISAGTFLLIYTERIEDSQLDPRAILYGPHSESGDDVDPTSWIANDDDSHGNLQPEIRFPITETGYYFLRISYYQNVPVGAGVDRKEDQRADTGAYRLFVQELPDQPDITVYPSAFDFAVGPNQTEDKSLVIGNEGSIDLDVSSITHDVPWLNESPTECVVPPGSTELITVTVNSDGLDLGTYSGTITITSNDPDDSLVTIPVVLTVALADSNETPETATPISVPHQGDYAIAPDGDVDWYRTYLETGTAWLIYTERINGSSIDPEVWFYGPHSENGEDVDSTSWIANDDDSHGGLQPELTVNITETGFYYLRIAYYANNPTTSIEEKPGSERGATGEYRLIIDPTADGDMTLADDVFSLITSPNPASDFLRLGIRLPVAAYVRVGIYDLSGRLIVSPVNESLQAGYHVRTHLIRSLSPGAYVCRVKADDLSLTRRVLIQK